MGSYSTQSSQEDCPDEGGEMSIMADYTIYHRVVHLTSQVNPTDGKIYRYRSSINVRFNV